MANIDRIVNVQIALQTTAITEVGFGTPCILTPEFSENARVLAYTSADQVLDDGATTDSLIYKALLNGFSQIPRRPTIKVAQIKKGESVTDALVEANQEDSDWYGLCTTLREPEDILDIAAWIEAQTKIFGTATNDPNAALNTAQTDILYLLKEKNYYRTFGFYHKDAAVEFPELAVMARCFSILPGGETWANKKLAAVTTDKLTETQYLAITKKNGNTFEPFRNVSITQNGKVAAGEWIDVIRFRDWLQEDMKVRIFSLLINNEKIAYTDDGIRLIESKMRASLELGQRRGGIAGTEYDEDDNPIPGFSVLVPLSSSISFNDKANRILNDCKFSANLAGAVHIININGTLTYNAS